MIDSQEATRTCTEVLKHEAERIENIAKRPTGYFLSVDPQLPGIVLLPSHLIGVCFLHVPKATKGTATREAPDETAGGMV